MNIEIVTVWTFLMLRLMQYTQGECEMTLSSGQNIRDVDRTPHTAGTLQTCLQDCRIDTSCLVAVFRESCFFGDQVALANLFADDESQDVYIKQCVETPESTTLPSTTTTTAKISREAITALVHYNVDIGVAAEWVLVYRSLYFCETACSLVSQCEHYVQDSNVCKLYTSHPSLTSKWGSILGRKVKCLNGLPCCYQIGGDIFDLRSPQLSLTSTAPSCQELCMSLIQCQAVLFDGYTCRMYTRVDRSLFQPGRNIFVKPNGVSSKYSIAGVCIMNQ
ncbi:uncharacterized protein LOC106056667 [Biomphalaria glabrata]|uniref:Uncharacterized protein LOC106056667 n=1 Tax=Biomphalaria glabrata TaxID=6526 RepID=A0A9W2ZSN9_BIOGL|nr:uncharacterized protein LOC106056667 [Biomphalaria glabrata]XP_055878027.1 uncharacterized protein LOC106056667 [Biomphalaria glabrata]XP_055878029.1 uncharacterized protein LOC106056667 [Biomphalaria glabrata]XP_055878030.1 uncharacterized protein LOC106056667 [Biomphalaria glabrata]